MATVESAQFARYFALFPELTPTQAMTCILFSMGLAIPNIAHLRDVSVDILPALKGEDSYSVQTAA